MQMKIEHDGYDITINPWEYDSLELLITKGDKIYYRERSDEPTFLLNIAMHFLNDDPLLHCDHLEECGYVKTKQGYYVK